MNIKKLLISFLFLSVTCTSCATNKIKATPPTGKTIFSKLIANSNIPLNSEPACNSHENDKGTIADQLSINLSASDGTNNITTVKSWCDPDKFELPNKKVIDIWKCHVEIRESNPDGAFVSSSTISFGLTKDKQEFIKGSVWCL